MKPALSIVVFTVATGAGLGLLIMTAALAALATLSSSQILIAGTIGLVLTAAGLVSSTFHLANRKNAWRAFSRFRSSWLSREGVFALLLFPLAIIYLAGVAVVDKVGITLQVLGLLVALLALATLFATGMIYAVLRTIPQWNTALVPVNFIVLGLASGALLLTLILFASGSDGRMTLTISLVLLVLGWLGKALYFVWVGQPQGPSINTATGFTRARVKLLDIGHSAGTFNTKEFGFEMAAAMLTKLRWGMHLLAFIVPLGFGFIIWDTGSAIAAFLALISCLVGLLIERWLFFAEARHSVNLFHGQQRI